MMESVEFQVPLPDHDGVRRWIEQKYTDNRWSNVHVVKNSKTGGSVSITSGKYPSYNRFIKDIRPVLHEHGFVISKAAKEIPREGEKRHYIKAIPMMWVVLYATGFVCQSGACRTITEKEYCGSCAEFYDSKSHSDDSSPVIINP